MTNDDYLVVLDRLHEFESLSPEELEKLSAAQWKEIVNLANKARDHEPKFYPVYPIYPFSND